MRKNNKNQFPKVLLKNLVQDIRKLISSNEGRLLILELFEEVPLEVRSKLLEAISSFYEPEIAEFYTMLRLEYGQELEAICRRCLEKFSMAGVPYEPHTFFRGEFYKAYATKTRNTGKINIDIAWKTSNKEVHVESLYLTYSSDGIHSFFVIENMSKKVFDQERAKSNELVEVDFDEVCYLVQESYSFNLRAMTRPALGKYLYQKYLDKEIIFTHRQEVDLLRQVSSEIKPRQLVNCFFYALRHQDYNYIFALLSKENTYHGLIMYQLNDVINPGALLLEGKITELHGYKDYIEVHAYTITVDEHELYKHEYIFELRMEKGLWQISDINKINHEPVASDSEISPFLSEVICKVYQIIDHDELFDVLEKIEDLREVEELPYGVHLRITTREDDINEGVTFLTGITADLIINGEEFVIIAKDEDTFDELDFVISCEDVVSVILQGEYKLSLLTAYSYIGGHYTCFEEVLLEEEADFEPNDGMRYLTIRYYIKDRDKVVKRLEAIKGLSIELPGNCSVYYQITEEHNGFLAEYVLGANWLTLSAFGERDMGYARRFIEEDMYECLEFDGMEVREDGMFDILTSDVKKQYPDLEYSLKELYLNKWYHSRLNNLQGMSPSEARETEEGTRMLWTMFKNIKKSQNTNLSKNNRFINLKEYIQKVELKKE